MRSRPCNRDKEDNTLIFGKHRGPIGRRLRWGIVGLALLGGCTIMQPIQTPADDRRFPQPVTRTDGSAPCVNPELEGLECRPMPEKLNELHGDLPRAIWEMDERRRQLVAQGVERTNVNSTYNALLWPLGAFFVAKALREPNWNVRDLAAVGIGSYGLLNSGIPERDQLYLRTAKRMHCALVVADAGLYRSDAVVRNRDEERATALGGPWCQFQRTEPRLMPLESVMAQLKVSGGDYGRRLADVLPGLALRSSGAPAASLDAVERRRHEVLGRGTGQGGSSVTKEALPALEKALRRNLANAQALLAQLQMQHDSLADAGSRLRQQRSFMEMALAQGLSERTPALLQPQEVARQVLAALKQQTEPGAGTAQSEKVSGVDAAPSMATLLAALTPDSRSAVAALLRCEGAVLGQSMDEARLWLQRHEKRVQRAINDAAERGCQDGTLAQFAASLAPAASAPAASAPAGTSKVNVVPLQ